MCEASELILPTLIFLFFLLLNFLRSLFIIIMVPHFLEAVIGHR